MITLDLHMHTKYSHGVNTAREMYEKACELGLKRIGFSEHSPRPLGFDYTHEYRDSLTKHLKDYVHEVTTLRALGQASPETCQVLFGMEMDWLAGQENFMLKSATAFDFDYLIGSVHFIKNWGFDDTKGPWETADQQQCEQWYKEYFYAWRDMLSKGLYNIAAHPDLIKIFSVDKFHRWLANQESMNLICDCLIILKEKGMALEISSAGLRKPCQEIYPAPEILELASKLDIPITFASDAHNVHDIAAHFDKLEEFAKQFGYHDSVYFEHGKMTRVEF